MAQEVDPAATTASTEPRYRIELLVFRHLDSAEEGSTETELRDFSNALDLLTPPEIPDETEEAKEKIPPSVPHTAGATQAVDGASAGNAPPGKTSAGEAQAGETLPTVEEEPPVELIEMQSEAMQHAWRRLRGSPGFRPEQFMAWEQSMDEPFPFIRVHDLVLLKEVDPLADLPASETDDPEQEATDPPEAVVFNDTTNRPGAAGDGDDASNDSADEAASAGALDTTILEPQPLRYYRIDGITRLRRSRFLHLDLDIELREPSGMPAPFTESETSTAPNAEAPVAALPGSATPEDQQTYVVHKLSQSRQVQTTKYEYFDGATVSVLALITRIDPAPAEMPPAETPPLGEVPEAQP